MIKDFFLNNIEINTLLFDSSIRHMIQVIPFVTIVAIIYSCSLYFSKKESVWRNPIKMIFVCYLAALISLTCVPPNFWQSIWSRLIFGYGDIEVTEYMFTGSVNFSPSVFRLITGEQTGGSWIWTMLITNIIMFIPFGFLLPLISKRGNFLQVVKIGTIFTILIEIIQPIFGRSFDMDDIICNILGTMIGYGIFVIIKRAFLP